MKEYIITELTKEGRWCLHQLTGEITEEGAKRAVARAQERTTKKLRYELVGEEECWWNEGNLD